MKIDKDMIRLLTRQNVIVVGTVSPEGAPNPVSYTHLTLPTN